MIEPKTWTTEEIVELMVEEIKAYKLDCQTIKSPIDYKEMAECVLGILDDKGIIERTP